MFLTIESMRPLALPISDNVQDVIGYPLQGIVFVLILILLSIICLKSCLMQLNSKPKDMEFRQLFYDSFFGQESQVWRSPIPIPTIITVPISLWYIWTIVHFAYYNYEVEFAQFFHPLQLYPSVLLFFQTLFQGETNNAFCEIISTFTCIFHCSGGFLLWTFSVPSFAQELKKQESFASDIQEYFNTNFVLLIHSICLIVIVTLNEMPVPNFKNLVVGEILYRIIALIAFFTLNKRPTDQPPGDHADQPPGDHADQPPGDHADQPPGDHADQPPGDHADQPPGDHADQPPGDHADQPPGDHADQPPGDHADQPPGDHADQPPGDDTDQSAEITMVVQSTKVLPSSGSKGNLDISKHTSDTPSSSTNSDNTSHSESTFPSAQAVTPAE